MAKYIVCYSEKKDDILRKLIDLGAKAEDLGFNNLVVQFDGRVEELKAIEGVTAADEEGQKKPC